MSDLRMEAARRAVALLKASQLAFCVMMPDGTQEGTLVAAPEKKGRTAVKINNFVKELDYINVMRKMDPGQEKVWEHSNFKAFGKVVSAAAHRLWGTGNYISEAKDGKVVVLRVS